MTSNKTLSNAEIKQFKQIGHQLQPVVTIGDQGLSDNVVAEIERALTDHELIKIKLPAGSKNERNDWATKTTKLTNSVMVMTIGRVALLFRKNPEPNPKLSNLIRHQIL